MLRHGVPPVHERLPTEPFAAPCGRCLSAHHLVHDRLAPAPVDQREDVCRELVVLIAEVHLSGERVEPRSRLTERLLKNRPGDLLETAQTVLLRHKHGIRRAVGQAVHDLVQAWAAGPAAAHAVHAHPDFFPATPCRMLAKRGLLVGERISLEVVVRGDAAVERNPQGWPPPATLRNSSAISVSGLVCSAESRIA
ncbi:MAG: hypothetical protein M0Z66_01915 [Thermaerobacter sp.]|nr:hypothetical protein [Thermaerobacter sp.]